MPMREKPRPDEPDPEPEPEPVPEVLSRLPEQLLEMAAQFIKEGEAQEKSSPAFLVAAYEDIEAYQKLAREHAPCR